VSLPVTTTPRADAHIREIDLWWRVNRQDSPNLFIDELTRSFLLLGNVPGMGKPYRLSFPETRRLLLRRTRYHVYYAIYEDEILILAVWHAGRGTGPSLR
jgi:plasmid stabilization system protein ParE